MNHTQQYFEVYSTMYNNFTTIKHNSFGGVKILIGTILSVPKVDLFLTRCKEFLDKHKVTTDRMRTNRDIMN